MLTAGCWWDTAHGTCCTRAFRGDKGSTRVSGVLNCVFLRRRKFSYLFNEVFRFACVHLAAAAVKSAESSIWLAAARIGHVFLVIHMLVDVILT